MATVPTGTPTSPYKNKMFDILLEVRSAGAAALSSASADRQTFAWEGPFVNPDVVPLDLGNGRFVGKMIIDVQSMDIVSEDEEYTFVVLGHNDAVDEAFPLGSLTLGAKDIQPHANAIDSLPGRYEINFSTDQGEVVYPKISLGVLIFGTTPSLDFTAYVTKHD
jgi:hypothetical protein